ncbi:MAG: 5-formyltetrahydrofolate cyclo-ligase [Proteobacteria bacterium]|nr:5-formyltetrahydrofolate cyclo-ligase [Pseudomonadota bacterium]
MFAFLNLGTRVTNRWLNADQVEGQAQPFAAERKGELRKILRDSREKLKQDSVAQGLHWGAGHLRQLSRFLHRHGLVPDETDICSGSFACAAYWPINSELNLIPAAEQLNTSTVRWLLPAMLPERELEWFSLSSDVENWPKDKRGLPVLPAETTAQKFPQAAAAPWVVFTPCLAADKSGSRLGYGGGYYDRFISRHGEQCLLVACVPESHFLEFSAIPKEAHDRPVDVIITENQMWITGDEKIQKKIKLFDQLLNKARG